MKAAIVGAGNVAWHLAKRLKGSDFEITQIYSRHLTTAQTLCRDLELAATATDSLDHLSALNDAVIIAVPDNAIPSVIQQLPPLPDTLITHTSASVPLTAIGQKFHRAKVYPFQTFTRGVAVDWAEVPVFIVTDDDADRARALTLAGRLSPKVRVTDDAFLARLHVAAAFACNFVCHLLDLSCDILGSQEAIQLLQPLVQATIDKAAALGPHAALTGPARRGDTRVIAAHQQLLQNLIPSLLPLYRALTDSILRRPTQA